MVKYKTKRGVEKLRIYIPQHDIKDGIRFSPSSCPIARAIRRNLGEKAFVSRNGVSTDKSEFSLCRVGQSFISEFDLNPTIPPGPTHIILTRKS